MDGTAADGGSAPSGAEMLAAALRELVAEIRALDPEVRVAAPASVHDLRVAVRRLRSTLASYAEAFDDEATRPLREGLRWFGGLLGDIRDPEVQGERLRALGAPLGGLLESLAADEAAARAALAAAMNGDRYAALLDRLVALAEDPPFTAAADRDARDLVRAGAHEGWRRVESRITTLPEPDHHDFTERLHQVRKSAKRLQYVLESGQQVAGRDADRLRKRVTTFQRRLGDHHDATLTRRLLAGSGHPDEQAGREVAAVVDELPGLWRRMSERARRWLH